MRALNERGVGRICNFWLISHCISVAVRDSSNFLFWIAVYLYCVSKKPCHFYFLNNFVKHWLILLIFLWKIMKQLHINDCDLTVILLLCYLVKYRICILVIYNNELMQFFWDTVYNMFVSDSRMVPICAITVDCWKTAIFECAKATRRKSETCTHLYTLISDFYISNYF